MRHFYFLVYLWKYQNMDNTNATKLQQEKAEIGQYLQTGITSNKNVPFVKKEGITIVGNKDIHGYKTQFPNRAARRAANKKK